MASLTSAGPGRENPGTDATDGDGHVERAARAGLTARGVMYVTIGILAVRLALGGGGGSGSQASSSGALAALSRQPFGVVLLVAVALGLLAYGAWRAWQAWAGPYTDSAAPNFLVRLSFAFRALLYLGLSGAAWKQVFAGGGTQGGDTEQSLTAELLKTTWGTILVAGVAIGVIVVGAVLAYKGVTHSFLDDLSTRSMSRKERKTYKTVGLMGFLGRGVAFLTAGGFLLKAALTSNSDQGVGLDAALKELSQAPYGPGLLGLVAFGLMAFGLTCFIQARYARVKDME